MATATQSKQAPKQERKKRAKVDQNESKREKFVRLATRRVNRALSEVERIGNLSAPAYDYQAEDVEKVFNTLRRAIDAAETRFVRSDREDFSI